MKRALKGVEETNKFAEEIISKIKPQKKAKILALSGNLGAGKTTLTQALAKHLGIKETVNSPTFVIMKIYKISGKQFSHLIHIDAYRLGGGDELIHLGWNEISSDPKNLIVLEWPEKVLEILPKDTEWIKFEFVDEETREVEAKMGKE